MSATLINFKKNIAGQKQQARGIPCGEHLVVSYAIGSENTYQVFKTHDGKLFVPVTFTVLEDALEMGKWWEDTYDPFFCIYETYPDADIISLAKWSVKNGVRIYELVNELKRKHEQVDKSILSKCWEVAQQNVKGWMRI
jgi:hypothetical protein